MATASSFVICIFMRSVQHTGRALSSTLDYNQIIMCAMPNLADRIKRIRSEMGLSGAEFARRIGASRSAVNQIEDGTTKSLKATTLVAIERASGFNADWVATGRGQEKKRPGALPDGDEAQIDKIYSGLIKLPKEHRDKIEAEIDFLASLTKPPE